MGDARVAQQPPDFSPAAVPGDRAQDAPALSLVACFQTRESDYMKPPLEEDLLEPDGASSSGLALTSKGCTCHSVCTCVPVQMCACNQVCTCNLVTSPRTEVVVTHRSTRTTVGTVLDIPGVGGGGGGGGTTITGGGGGGYYAPCF
jgi:hypothetical protein